MSSVWVLGCAAIGGYLLAHERSDPLFMRLVGGLGWFVLAFVVAVTA